ncbi:hypothetical protein RB7177 [Rhodopirellula baltica SH 1]|uniref:Uncharacterized protein n=1 Tax=Rhodopirellula baltica (strain DSM 10527 / NCIMB 13988 / SH1) TaxID=243090 RepID=Q7UP43_RHOBA|nr:hypothetical protein RB7177 [Rhodopirellula baltica SH 1]
MIHREQSLSANRLLEPRVFRVNINQHSQKNFPKSF